MEPSPGIGTCSEGIGTPSQGIGMPSHGIGMLCKGRAMATTQLLISLLGMMKRRSRKKIFEDSQPPLGDLLVALEEVDRHLLAVGDLLRPWAALRDMDPKKRSGRWRKQIPRLGAAIRNMLTDRKLPPILAAIAGSAADLAERDAAVAQLGQALTRTKSLLALLNNLLIFNKSEYYEETTGIAAGIQGLFGNCLIDSDQKREVRNMSNLVLSISNQIARQSVVKRKIMKAVREAAVRKASAPK